MLSCLFKDLKVVYEDYEEVDPQIPYMSGFLAFRECPAYLRLLNRVQSTTYNPQVQILIVD